MTGARGGAALGGLLTTVPNRTGGVGAGGRFIVLAGGLWLAALAPCVAAMREVCWTPRPKPAPVGHPPV